MFFSYSVTDNMEGILPRRL